MDAMSDAAVEVRNLSRSFGRKRVLDDVSLTVPRGCVFGLLGENGAGKTTLIKHLLGALRAKEGEVNVFGMDPVRDTVDVLSRIGYLSEDRDMPGWMRVGQLLRYTRAFYPNWDPGFAEELRTTFRLDKKARIKQLSRGERAQAGLLIALAHRPDLLLLDEPSSGLDAIVRRNILGAIVRTVADEGRTVFFSSHLLDEVERVSDYVAMIVDGRVVLCDKLDHIKDAHHRFTLRFPEPQLVPVEFEGVLYAEGEGREWTLTCHGSLDALATLAEKSGAQIVEQSTPSLEDIFVARAGARELAK
jgi:ABC-2 type transport system ATP-binding protein